jgi:N-acetylmuramic acid 6-phosphate etherase
VLARSHVRLGLEFLGPLHLRQAGALRVHLAHARINAEDRKVAEACGARDSRHRARRRCHRGGFRRGGRLVLHRRGNQRRLGVLDASECPPTFNVPPELVQGIIAGGEAALSRATETTEDDPAIGARDLQGAASRATMCWCGIAASGRTPYVLGAIAEANRLGALTIGISCTPDSELARAVRRSPSRR